MCRDPAPNDMRQSSSGSLPHKDARLGAASRRRQSTARLLIGGQVAGAPPLLEQFGWGAVREAAPEVVAVGNPQQHLGAQPLQALGLPGDLRPQQAVSQWQAVYKARSLRPQQGMVSCRCSIATQLAIRDTVVPMTTKSHYCPTTALLSRNVCNTEVLATRSPHDEQRESEFRRKFCLCTIDSRPSRR